jgi:hypothetical protein
MAAPLGNQNAVKGKRWRHAINRAIDAWPDRAVSLESNRGIDNLAYEFVAKMYETKDLGFFKEYGDREDGKPAQALIHTGDEEGGPVRVEKIELVNLT